MEHSFTAPSYTLGIEEELMIVRRGELRPRQRDRELLQDAPQGEIKPELMESVLEISTDPCADTAEAGRQLRALRRRCSASPASAASRSARH